MSQVQSRRLGRTIGTLQIAIIILVAITAFIHLQRGIGMSLGGFGGGPPGGFRGGPPGGGGAGGPPGGFRGGPPGFALLQALPIPLPTLFLLNGLGYLVLVVALYLPPLYRYQRIVRWLLIGYAAVTLVMYFLVNGLSPNPMGIIAKAAEVALIVLLLIEDRQAARSAVEAVPG